MKIIQQIQAQTPKWAAKCLVLLGFVFSSVVALQETKVIDILPIDPEKRDTIKSWVAIIVIIGGLFFSSRKTAAVTTTVTTPEPPKIDLNQDMGWPKK